MINDLKAFGVSRVTNDTYFRQEFYVDNLTDFDFIIKSIQLFAVPIGSYH